MEGEIRGLLRPDDYATYETLKDSDLELFKLNEYAAGISNVAPLSAADRESILRTKLAYKERFRQLLLDSGLQRTDLSAAEREYAYSVTSRALEGYRRAISRKCASTWPTKNNLRCSAITRPPNSRPSSRGCGRWSTSRYKEVVRVRKADSFEHVV